MTPGPVDAPVIQVLGANKVFPGVQALTEARLTLHAGEVLGLVGENGAGKSTLGKAIAGVYRMDSGEIQLDGQRILPGRLREHQRLGIGAIYQELSIVPQLTAAQNVFLHAPDRRGPVVDRRGVARKFYALAERVGATMASNDRAGNLSVADQQLIEIMRALASRYRVLIMDEPSAALGASERAHLHTVVTELRTRGIAVIYITHDLDEVLELASRIVVMRAGRTVEERNARDWTKASLVTAMLGTRPATARPEHPRVVGAVAYEVRDLTVPGKVHGVSFEVRRGEILGIAGLVGSGRTELLRALAGADHQAQGTVVVEGRPTRCPTRVRAAIELGIGIAPEDRKVQGLVPERSGAYNVGLASLQSAGRFGVLSTRRLRSHVSEVAASVGFDPSRLDAPANTLSGGNQQKLLLARWLRHGCKLLLLDEPTRGIDIGGKGEVRATVREITSTGRSVIFVSSELDEVTDIADRVLVMASGHLIGAIDHGEASVKDILSLIFAVEEAG